MKKQWRNILLAAGSAVSSMIVAALLHERKEDSPTSGSQAEPARAEPAPERRHLEPATKRDMAINFLSDLLAETYRKLRSQEGKTRR